MSEPMFRKLYVGIRPRLHHLTKSHASAVFMYLLTRLDDKTGKCCPAAATIANDLGLDVKTVRKAFKIIEEAGVATRSLRDGACGNWSFTMLDIKAEQQPTLPVKRVYPRDGYTHGTDSHPTRETDRHPTRQTGTEEKRIEEETKEEETEASGQGGFATSSALEEWEPQSGQEFPTAQAQGPEAKGRQQDLTSAALSVGSGEADRTSTSTASDAAPASVGLLAATPPVRRPRRKGTKLTEAEEKLIRASSAAMCGWLGYGPASLDVPFTEWHTLDPYDRNWFHGAFERGDSPDSINDKANSYQFAAWTWHRMNALLESRSLPLVLPNNRYDLLDDFRGKNRKKGILGDLLKANGPEWVIHHVDFIVDRFDELMNDALDWMKIKLAIGPAIFRNERVIEATTQIFQQRKQAA